MSREQAAAVIEPGQQEQADRKLDRKQKPRRQPRYHVVLWDDPNHSFDYVITMMKELFGHPDPQGFQIAEEVHTRGRAIVLTTTLEHAELKRDQIRAYGPGDPRLMSKGSMYSTIEPETGS